MDNIFSIQSLWGFFSNAQGQITPQPVVGSGYDFEYNRDLMYAVVPCKYGKDLIKNSGDNAWTPFSHYKYTGIFSNAQGQVTPQPEVGSG